MGSRVVYKRFPYRVFHCIGLLLILFYSGCTTISPWSYVLSECSMITCLVTWSDYLSSHAYLYLNPIVCLEVIDQMFKYAGSYFPFRTLITVIHQVILCSDIFFFPLESSFGVYTIAKYYLFSNIVHYSILEHIPIYHSTSLSSIRSVFDTNGHLLICDW